MIKRTLIHIFIFLILLLPVSRAYDLLDDISNLTPTSQKQYLKVNEAFIPSITQKEDTVLIKFYIAPNYYLYRHLFKFDYTNAISEEIVMPEGIYHEDDFMGKSYIFKDQVEISIKFKQINSQSSITIQYQGCTKGMCYPRTKVIHLLQKFNANKTLTVEELKEISLNESNVKNNEQNENLLYQILSATIYFIIGITLAFTPCVFPMYPALSILILGSTNKNPNTSIKKNFILTFLFVQGIAIAYTMLGLLSGILGAQIHAFLQHPFVLISFSLIFVILSLSMIGLFEIKIPTIITNKLQKIADQQQSRSYIGALLLGIVTALICSPCTTAPISASILYNIHEGKIVLGCINLYLLGIGIGFPMLLIGTFGRKVLPKSGEYLNLIKKIIGIFSLSLPLILLSRMLPNWTIIVGVSILIVWTCIEIILSILNKHKLLLVSIVVLLTTSNNFVLLKNEFQNNNTTLQFTEISDLDELKQEIQKNDYVMVDFYATWCASCKQYEKETFKDPIVQKKLEKYKLIRIDLSEPTDENDKISSFFNLVGLPSIVFVTKNEQKLISGFYDPDSFSKIIIYDNK